MAHLQDILIQLEPVFLLLAVFSFFRSSSARRLPAFAVYFVVRLASLAYLEASFHFTKGLTECRSTAYEAYFWGYWISYIAIAVAIFFVVQEIFKRVMEPIPGLRRLGLMAFRWISIVSMVISVGAIALPAGLKASGSFDPGPVALQTARCVSVMELCLLAFLALTIHSLGRSFRSRLFGIALGFGLQSVAELVVSALQARHPGVGEGSNLFLQIVITVVLVTWTAYFLAPEPVAERNMIILPPESMLSRWNALAKGLGQMPQPVAAGAPTGFFLADIEGVVDRVLAKNPAAVPR